FALGGVPRVAWCDARDTRPRKGDALKTKIQNTLVTLGTLGLSLLLFGSAAVGLGACAAAQTPPSEPPLEDAKIEEIVASLGPDARPECQTYVRFFCKQKGITVAGCNRYADSVRGNASLEQGAIVCKAAVDGQPQPQQ